MEKVDLQIEKMFRHLQKQKLILDLNEVHIIIKEGNYRNPLNRVSINKSFFKQHLNSIIMITTIGLILAGLSLWTNPSIKTAKEEIVVKVKHKSGISLSNNEKTSTHKNNNIINEQSEKFSNKGLIVDVQANEKDNSPVTTSEDENKNQYLADSTIDDFDLIDIEGIPMLELTEQELEKFWVFIINGDIHLKMDDSTNTQIISDYIYIQSTYGGRTLKVMGKKLQEYKNQTPMIFSMPGGFGKWPKMITCINEKSEFIVLTAGYQKDTGVTKWLNYDSVKYDYLTNNFNTLTPVIIRQKEYNLKAQYDIILWYKPTNEFFERLPERFSTELQQEFEMITNVFKNQIATLQPAKSCTYFEVCRSTLTSVKDVIVYPNPVDVNVKIEFKLENPNSLRVMLLDINGKLVKELMSKRELNSGIHNFEFNLNDISSGMYLITIQAKNGEFKTERVFVK